MTKSEDTRGVMPVDSLSLVGLAATIALFVATLGLRTAEANVSLAPGASNSPVKLVTAVRTLSFKGDVRARTDFERFAETLWDAAPRFDARHHPGSHAVEPLRVNCAEVRSLGLYLFVDTRDASRNVLQSLQFRFRWTHATQMLQGRRFNDFSSAKRLDADWVRPHPGLAIKRARDGRYAFSRLELESVEERQEGVYTVVVTHRGDEIYRDSFHLHGCKPAQ